MSDLLSVAEAQQLILRAFSKTESVKVDVPQALRKILAEDVFSSIDLPAFSNSSMDGFAVRSGDVMGASPGNPVRLRVVGDVAAGHSVDVELESGQAVRIMTGGPLPLGSDAVVPVEDTLVDKEGADEPFPQSVGILKSVKPGDFIRPKGQDIRAGDHVMHAGTRLRPQDVGFLAMLGMSEVKVHRSPRVAVFSSGDELLPLGEPISYGKIYNSNGYTLISLIEKYGGEGIDLGIAKDNFNAVSNTLEEAVRKDVDLILSSAGVSVGERDYVRAVLESQGELGFWRVNMRPGKPLTFGHYRDIPFIGLPGNPVSAFVGFEVFVRPVLLKMAGVEDWKRTAIPVILESAVESDGRESYLRASVRLEGGVWRGELTGHQGSGNLYSLVKANALLLIPSGVKSLPVGAQVDGWLLDD